MQATINSIVSTTLACVCVCSKGVGGAAPADSQLRGGREGLLPLLEGPQRALACGQAACGGPHRLFRRADALR